MANTIIEKSLVPRIVTVGGLALELNSTTAEVIIETVIEEANEGKIDLTGFQSFWNIITFQVDNEMAKSQKSLDVSLPLCSGSKSNGFSCSSCACSFRNDVIQETLDKIDAIFSMAAQQAQDLFGEDVSNMINNIYDTEINPWISENSCSTKEKISPLKSNEHCDFSDMMDSFIDPSNDISISCTYAFVCNSLAFDSPNITVIADNIYIAESTKMDILPPAKAANGADGKDLGSSGGDGMAGSKGRSLYITTKTLLKGSKTSFIFTSYGGDGGDGGKGAAGKPGQDGVAGVSGADGTPGRAGTKGEDTSAVGTENDPKTADEVYAQPGKKEIDYWDHDNGHHCTAPWKCMVTNSNF